MRNLESRLSDLLRAHGSEADLVLADDVPIGESVDQRRGAAAQAGPHLLMLAVLEEGIRSYLSGNEVVRAEAESWVDSNTRKWPFAFASICDALGFDAGAARVALANMRAGLGGKRMRRLRGNVRYGRRLKLRRPTLRTTG